MEREELVRGVKSFVRSEWPKFKANIIEEVGVVDFDEDEALRNFKEVMVKSLSDTVNYSMVWI